MNRSMEQNAPAESPDRVETPSSSAGASGRACPACGATSRRTSAHFCATCGREFDDEGYLPLDSIRASYHLQNSQTGSTMRDGARRSSSNSGHGGSRHHHRAPVTPLLPTRRRARQRAMPFTKNSNSASTTALAFVTYALVPYLGILFCPGALLLGSIGLMRARRMPHVGGRRASVMSISMGALILCAQLVLWWILYKVPEWTQRNF